MSVYSKFSLISFPFFFCSALALYVPALAQDGGSGGECGGVSSETLISPQVCWGSNNNGDLVCTCTSPNGGYTWEFGPYRTVEECEARGKELGCEKVTAEMADKDAGNVCDLAESILYSEGDGELPDCPEGCGAQTVERGTTRYTNSENNPVIGEPGPNDSRSVNCCWAYAIVSCVPHKRESNAIGRSETDDLISLFIGEFESGETSLDVLDSEVSR